MVQSDNITELLQLEAGLVNDRVKLSLTVQRAGETQTVRQVEELSVSMERVNHRCAHLFAALNQANRGGELPPDLQARLAESGQLLRDELFSNTIKERLNQPAAHMLVLTLDDDLVHLPWELLHDGRQFLGQRFAMGRVVRTRQAVPAGGPRALLAPLRMLVLADPCGDLKAAYQEGLRIRDLAESASNNVQVTFRSTGVQADFLKAKLRQYDLLHFAGHADFNDGEPGKNGWRLGNDRLAAADIRCMAGTGSMPALVFANACQSARSNQSAARTAVRGADAHARFYDITNAFLLSGVKHYLGTFWEIPDHQSEQFAISFYSHLLRGEPVGEAVLGARRHLRTRFGDENILWAGYLLYGDPTCAYFQRAESVRENGSTEQPPSSPKAAAVAAGVRAPEERLHLGKLRRPRRNQSLALAALVLIAAAAGWTWFVRPQHHHSAMSEQMAMSAFEAGRFEQVERICAHLQREAPEQSLGYVLAANVRFFKGELDAAHGLYQRAVQSAQGPDLEKAEAYIGLGRIESVRGSADQALAYYRKAAQLAPDNDRPLVAQAVLQDRLGHPDQAAALLAHAGALEGDTQTLQLLARHLQSKTALAADHRRRERIDALVRDLVARMNSGTPAAIDPDALAPAAPKSGRPPALWLNDLESVGYNLQEGTATLITSGLLERLLQSGRFELVERDLLEGVMSELKLGTSALTAPGTRIELGRLTAARAILTGRIVHNATEVQVSVRCIETDTGQVFAVSNARFGAKTGAAEMAEQLADDLIPKLSERFARQ